MFDNHTKSLYKMRTKALTTTKKQLIKKGAKIDSITAAEKKSIIADFKMDGEYCKFKSAKNHNINILFEAQNGPNYGWIATTESKFFIMYYEADDIAYIIDIKRARDYINNPLHTIETTSKGGRSDGWSYMVSIDTLRDRDIIVDILHF